MPSNALKKYRLKRALTIRDLSALSGVNVATIVKIEKGKSHPYPITIQKLALALGVSVEKLTKEI